MGVNCDGIEHMRGYIRHMLDDRLRRGQRVRGWFIATRVVQLQCWLRIVINHYNGMCGKHWNLRIVWVRLQLRRRWRAGSGVYLFSGNGLDCDGIQRMRGYIRHMFSDRLRRRQRVCGRLDTARHLCMQRWLFIYIDDDNCVRGLHGHLLHMWCRI